MAYSKVDGFDPALQAFLVACQQEMNAYYAKTFPTLNAPSFEVEDNPAARYVRVWRKCTQKSAWGFIEKATGLIFKPDSWKRPAKHARGSLFSERGGMEAVDLTGVHIRYLS